MRKRLYRVIKHPLFSGSMIMVFGSNAVSFLNYLYHVVMGRMLGVSLYGDLESLISLVGLLGVIPLSISLVITKYVSSVKDENEATQLIAWFKNRIFLLSLFLSIIILILSPFISSFLKVANFYYMLLLVAIFLFSFQSAINRSILQGLLKFKEMVISVLAENSTKLIVGILLITAGFKVSGAMFGFAIAGLFGWYLTNLYLKYNSVKNVNLSPSRVISILKFTIPVAIQSLAITSLYSSDVILVKHFFPSETAGLYAALSTLGKIIFFATGPIGAVMFPLVVKRNALGQSYKKIFISSFFGTLFVAIVITSLYGFYPSLAIELLFGTKYLAASSLLVWFGLFISFFTLSTLLINYGLSLGKSRIAILPLGAAITQIILIWLFHQSLYFVILESTLVCSLLLLLLLIYLSFSKGN